MGWSLKSTTNLLQQLFETFFGSNTFPVEDGHSSLILMHLAKTTGQNARFRHTHKTTRLYRAHPPKNLHTTHPKLNPISLSYCSSNNEMFHYGYAFETLNLWISKCLDMYLIWTASSCAHSNNSKLLKTPKPIKSVLKRGFNPKKLETC